MVKKVLFFFLISVASLFAQERISQDLLVEKIQMLLDPSVYNQNKAYIDIVFSPKSDYYEGQRVDIVKVAQTLKENGLLNLFYQSPQELTLHFKTNGAPLFFVKIMGDTLRNIGYYRYVTKESNHNESEFNWIVGLTSEYATDPIILQKELQKSGCAIIDIQRESATNWIYTVDMREARLPVEGLVHNEAIELKRSLYAHWLDVSHIESLTITSSSRNNWYPYVAFYDRSLHLLEVIKEDRKMRTMQLKIPRYTKYIKISDLYTLKNIRDELTLTPKGVK